MGSGKTSVGQAYSRLTGAEFVDLDHRIVEAHGQIPDIFAAGGEALFRSLETEALRQAVTETGTVISAGGGVILSEQNRTLLADAYVVHLSIDQATARGRIPEASSRPMLAGSDPMQSWQRILEGRLPLYEQVATLTVDARSDTPDELAAQIASAYAMDSFAESSSTNAPNVITEVSNGSST
jgi:shikimate kinase